MNTEQKSGVAHRADRVAPDVSLSLAAAREAQRLWGSTPIRQRLSVLRAFRHGLASSADDVADSVPLERPGSLHRTLADTLAAEVLPLAEACRFLEREAAWVLAPQRPSTSSRPFWLRGLTLEIHREPVGVALIIGPANYPLFLPGSQALQALAAGNAALWKPAPGGSAAAHAARLRLTGSGLDPALLQILDESPDAATAAIRAGVDKVFLTGSAETGRAVMRELAETLTPSVMELSGCDAVFMLEGADLDRVVAALTFGLRLNGSATCMAPRRLFVTASVTHVLLRKLTAALDALPPVPATAATRDHLLDLLADAGSKGANILRNGLDAPASEGRIVLAPTLVTHATPDMRITQADIFAPVLSVIQVANEEAALAAYSRCPYGLTASIFGPRGAAAELAKRISAGSVLINDIIVPTADPRAPFGGRRGSGFGVTRGREGLLEMTAPKTVQTQRSRSLRAYSLMKAGHARLFASYLRGVHGGSWRERLRGIRELWHAARTLE